MVATKLFVAKWQAVALPKYFRRVGLIALIIIIVLFLRINLFAENLSSTPVTHLPIVNETLQLTSHVIVKGNQQAVETIQVTLTNVSTQRAVPVAPEFLQLRYRDAQQQIEAVPWTWQFLGEHNHNDLLEAGEHLQLDVDVTRALQTPLGANHTFLLEIQPQASAILRIQRTTPPQLSLLTDLQ